MKDYLINGIQQVGIGCADSNAMFEWYRHYLGFDIKVFEDEAEAKLMTGYTGDEVRSRHAILSMNMRGGGGLEIWQFTDRHPQVNPNVMHLGDLGVNFLKIRTGNIRKSHEIIRKSGATELSAIQSNPAGVEKFLCRDPWNNFLEVVDDEYEYTQVDSPFGGVLGVTIGVTDMDASLAFYQNILKHDKIVYDKTDSFKDFGYVVSSDKKIRRVLLERSNSEGGGFSKLLGPTKIELIQSLDRKPRKIYEHRYWGDLGFIHVCFDVAGMHKLKTTCQENGYPFTVDSADSFDMGKAAGHFSYVEDPDGTLIEFVETHKVPILKSLGLFINMKKRDPHKTLPDWLIKMMRIHRVK